MQEEIVSKEEEHLRIAFTTPAGSEYHILIENDPFDDDACVIRVGSMKRLGAANGVLSLDMFTERENEVLKLLLKGYTNDEIALALCISLSTVKSHVKKIFDKANVANRATLISRFYCGN